MNNGGDTEKLILLLNLKRAYPECDYIVTLDNGDLRETFLAAGVTFVLSKNDISAKLVSSYVFEPEVAEFANDLLSSAEGGEEDHDMQQYRVLPGNPCIDMSYEDLFEKLRKECNILLLGLSRRDPASGEFRTYKIPREPLNIAEGDYVIVIVSGKTEKEMQRFFWNERRKVVASKRFSENVGKREFPSFSRSSFRTPKNPDFTRRKRGWRDEKRSA